MDKKIILENGLLEQFVLGELNLEEEKLVLDWIEKDEDLKQKKQEIEISFERIARENSIVPPFYIKESLLKETKSLEKETSKNETFKRTLMFAAASVALIMLCVSVFLIQQLNTLKKDLRVVQEKNEVLNSDLEKVTVLSKKNMELLNYINNPKTQRYVLEGNQIAPNALLVNYINNEKQTIVVNVDNLPNLENNDYQMWADVEGQMINMGVIDTSKEVVELNYIQQAESINVTIEPKGGSKEPNVDQLIGSVQF